MSISFDSRVNQRGDVLLEALIGVLLTAIIGAGMMQVASRVAVGQRDAKVENLVVETLRSQLHSEGLALCDKGTTTLSMPGELGDVTATVSCPDPVQVKLTMGEEAAVAFAPTVDAPREIILRVAATDLGLSDSESAPALVVGTQQIPVPSL